MRVSWISSVAALAVVAGSVLAGEDPPPPKPAAPDSPAGVAAADRPPALRGLDPVELCAGREVDGKPEITSSTSRHRYVFASEENRERFLADPERWGIQFDGCCMRMGPLSPAGSADRFDVHDGRIYLFASDACRNRFRSAPESFIDREDEPPAGDAAATARGAELMALAVRGVGGDEALAKARNVRVRVRTRRAGAEDQPPVLTDRIVAFPGTLRVEQDWGSGRFAWLLTPKGGWCPAGEGPPVGDQVRRFMVREMYRQPVAILQAWRRGEAKAVALGSAKRGEATIEEVSVGVAGATTKLGLDPATGRIVEVTFRSRAAAGIVPIVRRFSDFRDSGGLVLPWGVEVDVDGKPVADRNEILGVEANAELPAALLTEPK